MAEVKLKGEKREHIHFKNSKGVDIIGIVLWKEKGNPLIDMKTGVRNENTVKLFIQPDDKNKAAFWTESLAVVDSDE